MLRFTCPSPTRRQPIQLKPKVKKAGGSGTSFNTHPGSCWNTLWGQRMTGHLLSLCCTLGHQDLTEGASTCVWHPHFCSCCQGAPVHCLGLVPSGAYAPGSHRTVTNEERDFQRLPPAPPPHPPPPRAQQETTDQETCLSVIEAYSLIITTVHGVGSLLFSCKLIDNISVGIFLGSLFFFINLCIYRVVKRRFRIAHIENIINK